MIIYLLLTVFHLNSVDVTEVRRLFTIASKEEAANTKMFELTSGYTMAYKPVVYGYHAAAEMTKANHTSWPVSKLSHFSKGKNQLEEVIRKYPNEIELRYIRFAVQNGSPFFLGYKEDMAADKKIILAKLDQQDWSFDFKNTVKAVLKQ